MSWYRNGESAPVIQNYLVIESNADIQCSNAIITNNLFAANYLNLPTATTSNPGCIVVADSLDDNRYNAVPPILVTALSNWAALGLSTASADSTAAQSKAVSACNIALAAAADASAAQSKAVSACNIALAAAADSTTAIVTANGAASAASAAGIESAAAAATAAGSAATATGAAAASATALAASAAAGIAAGLASSKASSAQATAEYACNSVPPNVSSDIAWLSNALPTLAGTGITSNYFHDNPIWQIGSNSFHILSNTTLQIDGPVLSSGCRLGRGSPAASNCVIPIVDESLLAQINVSLTTNNVITQYCCNLAYGASSLAHDAIVAADAATTLGVYSSNLIPSILSTNSFCSNLSVATSAEIPSILATAQYASNLNVGISFSCNLANDAFVSAGYATTVAEYTSNVIQSIPSIVSDVAWCSNLTVGISYSCNLANDAFVSAGYATTVAEYTSNSIQSIPSIVTNFEWCSNLGVATSAEIPSLLATAQYGSNLTIGVSFCSNLCVESSNALYTMTFSNSGDSAFWKTSNSYMYSTSNVSIGTSETNGYPLSVYGTVTANGLLVGRANGVLTEMAPSGLSQAALDSASNNAAAAVLTAVSSCNTSIAAAASAASAVTMATAASNFAGSVIGVANASSNSIASVLITATAASNQAFSVTSASYTSSNFSLHWYIPTNQTFSAQASFSNWTLDTSMSVVPNAAMSNLVASCNSNVYMVCPMKGVYSIGYADLSAVSSTIRMTSWLQSGSSAFGYSGGYGTDVRNGTIVTTCTAGQQWVVAHYHSATNTLYCGQGQTYMHMTLLYPLP
jgi:hypothetical protein